MLLATRIAASAAISAMLLASGPALAPGAAPEALPAIAAVDEDQAACLASAIWHEAGTEPLAGQKAVAAVVIARTRQPRRFAGDPCGVIRQRRQFSFVRRGRIPEMPNARIAARMTTLAHDALSGRISTPFPDALFYHATYVSPGWRLDRVGRIGRHIFYADPST